MAPEIIEPDFDLTTQEARAADRKAIAAQPPAAPPAQHGNEGKADKPKRGRPRKAEADTIKVEDTKDETEAVAKITRAEGGDGGDEGGQSESGVQGGE